MKTLHTINFSDTAIAFASKSTKELKHMKFLFRTMAWSKITNISVSFLKFALKYHFPIKNIVRNTLFKQFCGGETYWECGTTMEKLHASGIFSIPDYSVEGKEDEASFNQTVKELVKGIELAAGLPMVSFSVFKMSGIARFALLEKIQRGEQLSADESKEFDRVKERVTRLCFEAETHNVRLMVDAEETWIQTAIDVLYVGYMKRFNAQRPILFLTIQLYRKDGLERLKNMYAQAQKEGYHIGFKLVRGAYMEKERARANELKYPSPINDTKEQTDALYNQAVSFCLHEDIATCIATHNQLSIERAVREMDPKDQQISGFAQLYGMGDFLSYNLAHAGYNVSKYLPYGPLREVMPYLFRRAEENKSITGETTRELFFIEKELKRRKAAGFKLKA
ncbi:proline dehydrogenase family protein [Cytophaga hutchinsonii]|uniref:Proline dehydrogenase n=1 Tax=Cytophaga hutchinsonii (strain ATCC 33406 / DSM 1761 / CIP 103989 / NBRC 15051 / NCIMB 9469 / D465) TaxID=269798 RepID=A0A6N4SP26_CYTH3|nr:proline dehydrogenase family protein [Cytophaga hutchinsonii]ABG58007.1 proline dehydrogenase [Cytophaga hutchinsonii ATCC 33406]SFX11273.1 L-proline dehydrogenase [Cytophaga hutchinsonii ATCC 33406]